MTTNYSEPLDKEDVATSLHASTLPTYIVNKILQSLGGDVFVNEVNSDFKTNDLRGNDLVLVNQAGTMDLSHISKADIKDLNALVFTTNENVDFTLSGNHTLSFKGVVTTNGGDDTINLNSIRGVTVSSGYGNDSVNTGAGNDTVLTGAGNDSINTGAGDDIVFAGAGNDTINTGAGDDTVFAGAGNDIINTGGGNDSVSTGSGNDSVTTGDGNDTVYVGSGNDSVNTGDGADIVKLAYDFSGNATLDGGNGAQDTLDLSHVVITDVVKNDVVLTITLDDNSVITATNFEKFIYDSSTVDVDGGIVIVGINQFVAHDFSS
jgi:Ca2+-binding RTX toxin-like protein